MSTFTFILVIGVISGSAAAQRKREDILGGLAAFLLLSGRVPGVAYRQSATSSFLATATIATRLFRLLLPFVRATNHAVISLPVWKRIPTPRKLDKPSTHDGVAGFADTLLVL